MHAHVRGAALLVGVLAVCAASPGAQGDRASGIIAQARQAIGGEERLKSLHTLSLKAKAKLIGGGVVIRRYPDGTGSATRTNDVESWMDIQVDVLLPDRFLVTQSREGGERSYGISGTRVLFPMDARGFVASPQTLARLTARQHREFIRYMLALVLMPPERYGVQFADAGEGDVEGRPADVIEARAAFDFVARLFFDKENHRLLQLMMQDPPPAPPSRLARPAPPNAVATESAEQPLFKSLEGPEPTTVTIRMRLDDFRPVQGIALPHRIVSELGRIEEWHVTKVKVNERIDPRRFDR